MAAANRVVDGVVENLRTLAGAWAGGVAILEDYPPKVSPKELWDSVAFNNDDDRVRVARSQAKLVGAWSRSVPGLDELEAVAAHKKVEFPPAYRHFMARYGSLTLVPRELPSAPLEGLRKWAIGQRPLQLSRSCHCVPTSIEPRTGKKGRPGRCDHRRFEAHRR